MFPVPFTMKPSIWRHQEGGWIYNFALDFYVAFKITHNPNTLLAPYACQSFKVAISLQNQYYKTVLYILSMSQTHSTAANNPKESRCVLLYFQLWQSIARMSPGPPAVTSLSQPRWTVPQPANNKEPYCHRIMHSKGSMSVGTTERINGLSSSYQCPSII